MILFAKPISSKSLWVTVSIFALALSPVSETQGVAQIKKKPVASKARPQKTPPPRVSRPATQPMRNKAPPLLMPPPPPPTPYYPSPSRVPMEPSDTLFRVDAVEDGQAVVITGSLMDGSYAKVKRVLDATPKATTVILNSQGGLTYEGAIIGNLIQKRKLNTHVEHLCMSACTAILSSGQMRTAQEGARVGLHQSRNGSPIAGTARLGAELGDGFMSNAYRKAGVHPDFIKRAMEVSWNDMWFPDHAELLRVGLITAPSSKTAKFKPTGKFLRSDLRAELLAKPFWQKALAANQEVFEQALDQAWSNAVLSGNNNSLEKKANEYILSHLSLRLMDIADEALGALVSTLASEFSNEAKDNKAYCTSEWLSRANFLKFSEYKMTSGQEDILIKLIKSPVSKIIINDEDAYNVMADVYVRLGENSKTPSQFATLKQLASCQESADFFNGVDALPLKEKATIVRSIIRFHELEAKNLRTIMDSYRF
jgi:ATP-dependent protease ClpP protease subunit